MKKGTLHRYKKYVIIGLFSVASIVSITLGGLYVMASGGPFGYVYCSNEDSICNLAGSTRVAYGADGSFNYKTFPPGTVSIGCNNAEFSDPIYGVVKACYREPAIISLLLPWKDLSGRDVSENQGNGYAVTGGTSKEITVNYTSPSVLSECKRVTAPAGRNVFVPTKTLGEWNAFKAGSPGNLGVVIGNCAATAVNGVCGSVNGTTASSAPTVNLCSSGTPTVVSGNGPWTWNCQGSGGGSSSPMCQVSRTGIPQDGVCSSTPGMCSVGSVYNYYGGSTWLCAGINGGAWDSCTSGGPSTPVCGNGTREIGESCDDGWRNGTVGYCNSSCSGQTPNPSCVPNGSYTYGSCSVPCGGGTRARFDSCGSPAGSEACNTNICATPIAGVCGSSNGGSYSTAPSTGLCSAGTETSVSGSGPWTWSCNGIAGGAPASCSASKRIVAACVVEEIIGGLTELWASGDAVYDSFVVNWSDPGCAWQSGSGPGAARLKAGSNSSQYGTFRCGLAPNNTSRPSVPPGCSGFSNPVASNPPKCVISGDWSWADAEISPGQTWSAPTNFSTEKDALDCAGTDGASCYVVNATCIGISGNPFSGASCNLCSGGSCGFTFNGPVQSLTYGCR